MLPSSRRRSRTGTTRSGASSPDSGRSATTRDAELAKDTEVAKRDAIIEGQKKRLRKEERHNKNLVKRIARIKKFAELSMDGEVVPLKVMESLTREGLRKLAEDTGIDEGDLVFVAKIDGWGRSVIRDLMGMKVKAVVINDGVLKEGDPQLPHSFRESGLPLLSPAEIGAQVRGKQGLCAKDLLDACASPVAGRAGPAGAGEEV